MHPHLQSHVYELSICLTIQFPLQKSKVKSLRGITVKLYFVVSPGMPHVQRMEVDQDGVNLTKQMLVSLFHSLC